MKQFSIFNFQFLVLIILAVLVPFLVFAHQVGNQNINTNDISGEQWAWSDVLGWMDFHDSSIHNVEIGSSELLGYASSSVGFIYLNCASTGSGCGTSNFKVSNDGAGNLSGYAWNDVIGWVGFNCADEGVCGTSNYKVTVEGSGGNNYFKGYAWNDVAGWLDFSCENQGICSTSYFKVQTSGGLGGAVGAATTVFESNIFDSGSNQSAYNTIMWVGSQPAGTKVQFKFATANDSSPTGGWDSLYDTDWSPEVPFNTPHQLRGAKFLNKHYFRYKVQLSTDSSRTASPRIDDIIINWSP